MKKHKDEISNHFGTLKDQIYPVKYFDQFMFFLSYFFMI